MFNSIQNVKNILFQRVESSSNQSVSLQLGHGSANSAVYRQYTDCNRQMSNGNPHNAINLSLTNDLTPHDSPMDRGLFFRTTQEYMYSLCTHNPVLQGSPNTLPQLLVFIFQWSTRGQFYILLVYCPFVVKHVYYSCPVCPIGNETCHS